MAQFQDCVILFGGVSEERKVSVASSQNISQSIPEAKLWFTSTAGEIFEVTQAELLGHEDSFMQEFRPTSAVKFKSLKDAIPTLKGKIVIMGYHGTEGEDGTIQKMFEDAGIHFTGTGSQGSQNAFNKLKAKKVIRKAGIPVIDELVVETLNQTEENSVRSFFKTQGKIVLKPMANGSSVGLFIVSTNEELENAIDGMKSNGLLPYIAEVFISGREITVGVQQRLDGSLKALPASEVRVETGRQFDYEGKYLGSGILELTPAQISPEEMKKAQELALKTHQAVECRGYSRTDMILSPHGPVVLEINTLPGLSKASFYPQQLKVVGQTMREFFQEQINLK